MELVKNKDHWYHGEFYDTLIAPNQDKSFLEIKDLIERDSSVLDIGCATGRFAFMLQDKCSRIDGIDISRKNIKAANKLLSSSGFQNINFHHTDILDLDSSFAVYYDYAVLSYFIHEVSADKRKEVLKTISKYTNKIIISDYLFPKPRNFWTLLNEIVEFLAGQEHYQNFQSFIKQGGIKGLLKGTNLKVKKEIIQNRRGGQILVLEKQEEQSSSNKTI